VRDGHALPLHRVDAARRRVQDDVDEAVVQEVDFVDVQDAPVGAGL